MNTAHLRHGSSDRMISFAPERSSSALLVRAAAPTYGHGRRGPACACRMEICRFRRPPGGLLLPFCASRRLRLSATVRPSAGFDADGAPRRRRDGATRLSPIRYSVRIQRVLPERTRGDTVVHGRERRPSLRGVSIVARAGGARTIDREAASVIGGEPCYERSAPQASHLPCCL
jgi:hypothetical protein